jgi:two-component system cell cycle response regulator CpdR
LACTHSILLAEDEAIISMHLQSVLEDAGYDVCAFSCGTEALKFLEGAGVQPVGIVTDINLGKGPDGWDVARRARELGPLVRVVYMSGGAPGDHRSRGVPDSIMMTKPFEYNKLVSAMSGLLNAVSG